MSATDGNQGTTASSAGSTGPSSARSSLSRIDVISGYQLWYRRDDMSKAVGVKMDRMLT